MLKFLIISWNPPPILFINNCTKPIQIQPPIFIIPAKYNRIKPKFPSTLSCPQTRINPNHFIRHCFLIPKQNPKHIANQIVAKQANNTTSLNETENDINDIN